MACEQLANDTRLAKGYHAIGFSQVNFFPFESRGVGG
jgi:hypothetical protein